MPRLAGVALLLTVLGLLVARPAVADITEPPGVCVGTASFQTGTEADGPFTVSSKELTSSDVVTVPLSDTVAWTGELVGVTPASRPVKGFVAVDLPWPFGTYTVDSWGSTSDKVASSGIHEYDLPSAIPRGVTFTVRGEHWENGALFCKGTAKVQVEGGAFDTPATFVSVGLLALSGVGLFFAGRPSFRRVS
jgi:hypothetical protein